MSALAPVPALVGARSYHRARFAGPIDLHLDANEGAAPDPSIVTDLRDEIAASMRAYPSPQDLAPEFARRHGVEPERVVVTAGADDALDRACRAMLTPTRRAIVTRPTFEMIPRYARLAGATLDELPWPGGPFPIDAVLDRIRPNTGLVAVVSPNNPTGAVAARDQIEAIARAAPHALVVADLAYVEFADEDPTASLLALDNVVVTRTLSKARGLAGLRVGYALATERVARWLHACGQPYAVSAPSLLLARRAIEAGEAPLAAFVEVVRQERRTLESRLAALGASPEPSQANFVFARFDEADAVCKGLARRRIAVRGWPDHPDLGSALRITCPGDAASFSRLLAALEEVVR